jgi:hypothetical protein
VAVAGGSGLSYEDAMNREVEMGDISGGGAGGGQLTSAQVAAVMNQHVNRVYGACVVPEQARGGDLNGVTIDIAILGSGQVQGASAREGSQEFKSCVNRVVRGGQLPLVRRAAHGRSLPLQRALTRRGWRLLAPSAGVGHSRTHAHMVAPRFLPPIGPGLRPRGL